MHDFPLLNTIAFGFAAAWVLGMITHKIGLSPIVGYLLAGIAIGPHTPGFTGDTNAAQQLAEIGVILLMFGVGLHFHFKDLVAVRKIAVPGAIVQSLFATAAGVGLCMLFGWKVSEGLVLGVAMSVASTVVLMRVLMDANKMETPEGHAAVGWLIVEDIITVIVLVLIPALAGGAVVGHEAEAKSIADAAAGAAEAVAHAPVEKEHWAIALLWALGKLAVLVAIVVFAGSKIVPKVLVWVAKMRSRELFTLTVLVFSVAVATGSAVIFGASVALGAFLAGMVVGQSPVSRQAGADLLPLRDSFSVLFFVSVGMLFDPKFLIQQPLMVLAGLAIVLLVKPFAAILIVALLGYPARTALTVAVGLAQIGEFSFIVSQLGQNVGLMPIEGHNLLVACAIVSITINPLLFRSLNSVEGRLRRWPKVWKLLNRRADAAVSAENLAGASAMPLVPSESHLAIIVGYGPAGRHVDRLLRAANMDTLVIDSNVDSVRDLRNLGREAVYGDAQQSDILDQAGVRRATHLVLTMPDAASRSEIISAGRDLNPNLRIFARARYAKDQETLKQYGAVQTIADEIESAVALSRLVLMDMGVGKAQIKSEMQRIRRDFDHAETPKAPSNPPPQT